MFFGINSRSTSSEIVLHKGRDQTLYLIPKAWAFTPNVYDDRAGYTNAFNTKYRLMNGVGTIRITIDNELEVLTTDCKAEIFQEITPENIQYLNILGTPPKWLKYAWFKFELTNLDEDDLKNYVYHGFSGINRHVLDVPLEHFIVNKDGDIKDISSALKLNPLFQAAYGFATNNTSMLRTTFHSGVSLSNKQIVHHYIDQPLALASQDIPAGELTDKTKVWVSERMASEKELMDKFEEVILKRDAIGEEEIVQVFRISNPKNKALLFLRNRFSNEVSSHLLEDKIHAEQLKKLNDETKPYERVFYEYRSKDYEVIAVMTGTDRFCNLDILTMDTDVLTALFETQDGKVKFNVAEDSDELKKIVEVKEPKPVYNVVLYQGGLNLLSLPKESATISEEIVEFLEDLLHTEEGNW